MNLPRFTAEQSLEKAKGIYCLKSRPIQFELAEPPSRDRSWIVPSAQESEQTEPLQIYSCTRPMQNLSSAASEKGITISHCYAKCLKKSNGDLVDSRSFFADAGPSQEPLITGDCKLVKDNATKQDWLKLTQHLDQMSVLNYNVCRNNCCSGTYEACLKVPNYNKEACDMLKSANLGIGTKYKFCKQ